MLNYIRNNIDNVQELAKQKINFLLVENGYSLNMDNHNLKGIETRLIQWINDSKNHTVQLIWDGKEDWFNIGEFASTKNLNCALENQIITIPFRITKLFNRNKYSNKVVDSIIDALKETIKQQHLSPTKSST